jgi:hypothetical protein
MRPDRRGGSERDGGRDVGERVRASADGGGAPRLSPLRSRSDWTFRGAGTPGGIRTHDLRLRRPTLYPAELRAPVGRSTGAHACRLAPRCRTAQSIATAIVAARTGANASPFMRLDALSWGATSSRASHLCVGRGLSRAGSGFRRAGSGRRPVACTAARSRAAGFRRPGWRASPAGRKARGRQSCAWPVAAMPVWSWLRKRGAARGVRGSRDEGAAAILMSLPCPPIPQAP